MDEMPEKEQVKSYEQPRLVLSIKPAELSEYPYHIVLVVVNRHLN